MSFSQRWGKAHARARIINLLFEKPYRFNELFDVAEIGSRTTLNNYLKELINEGVVEQAFENNEPVYRLCLDPEVMVTEAKVKMLDNLLRQLESKIPGILLLANAFLLTLANLKIDQRVREINKLPDMTDSEFSAKIPDYFVMSLKYLDPEYDEEKLGIILDRISEYFNTENIDWRSTP